MTSVEDRQRGQDRLPGILSGPRSQLVTALPRSSRASPPDQALPALPLRTRRPWRSGSDALLAQRWTNDRPSNQCIFRDSPGKQTQPWWGRDVDFDVGDRRCIPGRGDVSPGNGHRHGRAIAKLIARVFQHARTGRILPCLRTAPPRSRFSIIVFAVPRDSLPLI